MSAGFTPFDRLMSRRLIDLLDTFGDEAVVIERPVSSEYEASREISKAGKKPIVMLDVDHKGSVIANLLCDRVHTSMLLNIPEKQFVEKFLRATTEYEGLKEIENGACGLTRREGCECASLPVLKYYESDAGKYVTSSVVIAKRPQTGTINASIHRLLYLGGNKFAVRIVEGRHLHQIYTTGKEADKDTNVCVLVGALPHILMAAATRIPAECSELGMAGSLAGKPLEVMHPDGCEIPVPVESEIILKGKIRKDLLAREWMTDILGTPDFPREQPVFEVEGLYLKEKPIFHAILPGGYEHKFLMGFPAEAKIMQAILQRGVAVNGVCLTTGSGGWLHCAVSIVKRREADAKESIEAAFETHRSLKGIVVVDDDIDVNSYEDIDFAFATRFQGDRVVFLRRVRGSSLDPSGDQSTSITNKWGVDLTLPLNESKSRFTRSRIS